MGKCMTDLVNTLSVRGSLTKPEFEELLKFRNQETAEYLFEKAQEARQKYFGKKIRLWGRIPLSNYCKNDCKYCGIRRSNRFASRYRMDEDDVLRYCYHGYQKGIRNFLIEGGIDLSYSEENIASVIQAIRKHHKDCGIILSLGEHSSNTYQRWFQAGAGSYLLRQGSAEEGHFKKLHSPNMSLLKRKQCLWSLKEIGYETGAGFLVGTPWQMLDQVITDLEFMKQFGPQIIDIAPFVPAPFTPFEKERSGNGEMTLYLMAILRLMLPGAVLTADLSMENVITEARKKALNASANILITDITEEKVRRCYTVYNRRPGRREEDDAVLSALIREEGYEVE